MSSEKFSLKWDDFQTNLISTCQELRESLEFTDVTLISEDKQKIEAHKMILSSASKFFKYSLNGNKHSNPMIYIRGVKTRELKAIVDFIYYGEVNVYQEDLEDFLSLAEELGINGVATDLTQTEQIYLQPNDMVIMRKEKINPICKNVNKIGNYVGDNYSRTISILETSHASEGQATFKKVNVDLDTMISSMMERIDGKWICTKCGKIGRDKYATKMHIETHIEGMSYPCEHCGKILRTRNSMQAHISDHHNNLC